LIHVDGSAGEGGGQIVRTSLTLAAATKQPVTVTNVRANRPKPGLRPQHVTAALALATLTEGRVNGAEEGSTRVEFHPGTLIGGAHAFPMKTAASIPLLLQALLPACAASRQSFRFEFTGGTDVPFAPTWEHFAHVHVPILERLGVTVDAVAHKRGYYPVGGGRVTADVDAGGFHAAHVTHRGDVLNVNAHVHAHGLPKRIVNRGAEALEDQLVNAGVPVTVTTEQHRGPGTGFALGVWARTRDSALGADGVGRRGVRAEDVAAKAARQLVLELKSGAAVDVHEADALPVYLALAGGGAFTTRALTGHARTTLDLLPQFLPVETAVTSGDGVTRVTIRQAQ
jgi:RNA 3'-phosphate cyclase